MAKEMKTIGVLTSGGDAPGMNAAIRAVTRAGIARGLRVIGIRHGYNGLITGDMFEMNLRSVSDIVHRGGTMLYSARSPEFKTEEGMRKAVKICREMGIDGIAIIGGDGSYRGARDLSERGYPCIGLPGTIDNDIACTDFTIGFDTAVNTVAQMVDRLRDTMESHDRCSVVEVMGRDAGDIAVHAGIAVGATAILVPELPFDLQKDVVDRIQRAQKTGKRDFIVMVCENMCDVAQLAKDIERLTGIETRPTVLGHVQRGGSPTVRDRVLASQMGYRAVELLADGIGNRVIAIRENKIVDYDIFEALAMKKVFDRRLYDIALTVGT